MTPIIKAEMFEAAIPVRRRHDHPEDRLQQACRQWFDAQYPRLRLLLHHSPNEGQLVRGARDGAKRRAMGMRPGFPDFVLLVPGKWPYLALELKSARGRQSPLQHAYQEAVEMAGGRYVLVRSLDDFMTAVREQLGR